MGFDDQAVAKTGSPTQKASLGFIENFKLGQIPGLIDSECQKLGIRSDANDDNVMQFSESVLTIRVNGPGQPRLDLLNLPGVYTSASLGQNQHGLELVKRLVQGHIADQKNILLLVVSAKHGFHTQDTPGLVRRSDDAIGRTLGVLTYPDLAQSPNEPFELLRNQSFRLGKGWCCLKNPSKNGAEAVFDATKRNRAEAEFFNKQNGWENVPPEQKGVSSLHETLKHVMFQHIQSQLPELIRELESRKERFEKHLSQLPPQHATEHAQRKYLNGVARRFEKLVRNATDGKYIADSDSMDFFGIRNDNYMRNDDYMHETQTNRLRSNITT
ncbi:hypothetical protein N7507_010000 [Penicillium longicatenatum]|nr:hypothetical protein N7507_010000 [Penicillium longicatenatum]